MKNLLTCLGCVCGIGIASTMAALNQSDGQTLNPVQWFRQLLEANPSSREAMLTEKSAWQRERIEAGINEFNALQETEREHRLRQLELRMHLMPILKLPHDERSAALNAVPQEWKDIVLNRLRYWDMYPPPMKDEILKYDGTLIELDKAKNTTESQRNIIWGHLASEKRSELEGQLAEWRSFNEVQRSHIRSRVDQFFQLPERDRRKALEKLSEQQRLQLGAILQRLSREDESKRRTIVNAFLDFISMSTDEQRQFALNADRWSKLSESDQDKWRDISATMPPMPPVSSSLRSLTLPPLPPLSPTIVSEATGD